jgi:hypothetical protein
VVAYAPPGVSAFGLSAVSGIFADRSHMGLPRFGFSVCADQPGVMNTDVGMCIQVTHGLVGMADADLSIVLPGDRRPLTLPAVVNRALKDAYRRSAARSRRSENIRRSRPS